MNSMFCENIKIIFNIGWYLIIAILIIFLIIFIFRKYNHISEKNRITDQKNISEYELDVHEVNIYLNHLNKHRRKTDRMDLKKVVEPTTGSK